MRLPYLNRQPEIGKGVFIAGSADIIGRVVLGDDSSVFFQCVLRADINDIIIGQRSNIQDHTTLHVASHLPVQIGDEVSIGHGCTIHACTLGHRILVGMGAIIMDGCQVGNDCLIAAGSLLPKDKIFPAGHLILGNPAKVNRPLTAEEITGLSALAQKYVGVKNNYLANPDSSRNF